jgi:hypothetical protein
MATDSWMQKNKLVPAAPITSMINTAMTAKYVCLDKYRHLTIYIKTGTWAGGTPAVSLLQARNVAALNAKALGFTRMWTGLATGDTFTETAVVGDTFNIAAVANTVYIIEIDAMDLDQTGMSTTGGPFDCVSLVIATPGANIDWYTVEYILSDPRYIESPMPTAILD